jgi:hypothetical protein
MACGHEAPLLTRARGRGTMATASTAPKAARQTAWSSPWSKTGLGRASAAWLGQLRSSWHRFFCSSMARTLAFLSACWNLGQAPVWSPWPWLQLTVIQPVRGCLQRGNEGQGNLAR